MRSSRREETRRGEETGRREKARGQLRKVQRKTRGAQVRSSSRSFTSSSQNFQRIYEVLYMTNPIDEYAPQQLREYNDKKLI